MLKFQAWQKKIAVKAILHAIVIGRGGQEIWLASDLIPMTQSSKATILKELKRLVSLGYLDMFETAHRPNSPCYHFCYTGKTGHETQESKHWYSVLSYNIWGVQND